MSTGFRVGSSRFLCLLMSFLIAYVPPAAAFQREYSHVAMDAPADQADSWHLSGQSFFRGTIKGPFNEYEGTIEGGRLVLRQGDAWHRFDDIDAVDFIIDPEIVTVLGRDGRVHVIQRKLLDGVVFRAPTVVHDVTTVKLDADPSEYHLVLADEDDLRRLAAGTADAKVRGLEVDPAQNFEEGDVLVVKDVGDVSEIATPIPRGLVQEELKVYSTIIRYWGHQLLPFGKAKRVAERNAHIPWTAAKFYQYVERDTLEALELRPEYWETQMKRPRDQFRLGPEEDLELADVLDPDQPIKPRTMAFIAAAAAGTATAATLAFEYGAPVALVNLVHATLKHWLGWISPVLVEPTYRWTMFKSALWMSTIPPMIMLGTFILDRTVTKLGDTPSTFLMNGSRVIAEVNEAIWRRVTQVLRQPHVWRAISVRQRPWRRVEPDSALGRRAGIDRPTRMGWISAPEDRINVPKLLAVREQMSRARHILAHHLALTVVAEEEDLDVGIVEALVRSPSPAARRALLVSPDWNRIKYLLGGRLKRELMARDDEYDVNTLGKAELKPELDNARRIMNEIREQKGWARFKEHAKYEGSEAGDKVAQFPEDFGRREGEFWRTMRPRKSLGWEAVRNFFLDYFPGGLIVYLKGSRANLKDPANLAAQEGALFSTQRQALYGNVDTGRWWAWNQAAIYTRVYQGQDEHPDTTFDPRELELLKPRYAGPGFGRSVKWWVADALNPSSGQYGELILNRLRLSTQMIQASYFLTTVMRWAVAGVSLAAASASFLWHLVVGHLAIGLGWDVVIPTNERMSRRIGGYRDQTEGALGRLHRGLRLADQPQWTRGAREALELFDHPEARVKPQVRAKVDRLKKSFDASMTAGEARELFITLYNHPPLPGKEPTYLKGMASAAAVYMSTRFGTYWDVVSFSAGLSWPIFLAKSLLVAAGAYTGIGLATHFWRKHQRNVRERKENCEFKLKEPGLAAAVGY